MSKWLGPVAYFGAVFGSEGESQPQPGVMGLVVSGLGGCSVSINGSALVEMSVQASSNFHGTVQTAQHSQILDLGLIAGGSGSVVMTPTANTPASSTNAPCVIWLSDTTLHENRSTKDAAIAVPGEGSLIAHAAAFVSLGIVTSGSGSMQVSGSVSESFSTDDEESEVLALLIALDLAA